MARILIILLIAFSFQAIGIVTLKKGLDQIGPRYTERQATLPVVSNVLRLAGDWFSNPSVLLGMVFETIFFVLLQYLLGQRDVSFVWPLTAVNFVITVLAAKIFLHERVGVMRWAGIVVILLGAGLISYGEQAKSKAGPPPAARDPKRNPPPG
jgi:drug/metabolite transporter (DMT)-like permease